MPNVLEMPDVQDHKERDDAPSVDFRPMDDWERIEPVAPPVGQPTAWMRFRQSLIAWCHTVPMAEYAAHRKPPESAVERLRQIDPYFRTTLCG